MIIELTKDNIDTIKKSFIEEDKIINEFNNNPFAKILILLENNIVVGYIYYSEIYERIEINQFEIEKSHRNCGKGKKLLQYMLGKTKKDVTLEVRKDNLPAIKLYQNNGFKAKAIRKGYYNGIDGILMERRLNK